jgi:hypothetical protein
MLDGIAQRYDLEWTEVDSQFAAKLGAIDSYVVILFIADVGVALGLGLDERSDATVPEEVDGRA